jgi:hypothetical protein
MRPTQPRPKCPVCHRRIEGAHKCAPAPKPEAPPPVEPVCIHCGKAPAFPYAFASWTQLAPIYRCGFCVNSNYLPNWETVARQQGKDPEQIVRDFIVQEHGVRWAAPRPSSHVDRYLTEWDPYNPPRS